MMRECERLMTEKKELAGEHDLALQALGECDMEAKAKSEQAEQYIIQLRIQSNAATAAKQAAEQQILQLRDQLQAAAENTCIISAQLQEARQAFQAVQQQNLQLRDQLLAAAAENRSISAKLLEARQASQDNEEIAEKETANVDRLYLQLEHAEQQILSLKKVTTFPCPQTTPCRCRRLCHSATLCGAVVA